MISRSEKIRCPKCSGISSIGEWNDQSYKMCTTKEMKDDYLPLTHENAFNREEDTYYMCPKCREWTMGCQLKIDTDNPRLKKLGGQPVVVLRPKSSI